MNAKFLLAVAAFAAAGAASAYEGEGSDKALQIEGARTRAEVRAEAVDVARNHGTEPAGSRVVAPMKSTVEAKAVRAQALQALRAGQISYGEIGL